MMEGTVKEVLDKFSHQDRLPLLEKDEGKGETLEDDSLREAVSCKSINSDGGSMVSDKVSSEGFAECVTDITPEEKMNAILWGITDIRSKQLFILQNIGNVKADIVKMKGNIQANKWFIDLLIKEAVPEKLFTEEATPSSSGTVQQGDFEQEESPGYTAIALYDYKATADDELSFDPDDIISNIEMSDEGWWRGTCKGRFGLFPANYVILQ